MNGKPSPSLFDRNFGGPAPAPRGEEPTRPVPPQPAPNGPRENYSDVDLWNKLNRSSTTPPPHPTPSSPREEFKPEPRYNGYSNAEQFRPAPPQSPSGYENGQAGSNLGSNIKIEDPDIPPFLRRKFNK